MRLWSKQQEKIFFDKSKNFASHQQLFYKTDDGRYIAYWPKSYSGTKSTLQARNSLIGNYTEKWVNDLFRHILQDRELYVIQQAQIPSIGITHRSPADIVIANKNKKILMPDDVKLIFEVKMSIVWNWEYDEKTKQIHEIGDYRTHQGRPSFTRSDSVLKAIGKCIDIRVSSFNTSKIPLIILGNAPLSNGFCKKADYLKKAGIIQGFWSLNPFPLNHGNTRKNSHKNGFIRFNNIDELNNSVDKLFKQDLNFFSGMENPVKLGEIIEMANREKTYEEKGLKFINLLKR
ncbi:hypothetical protein [Methanobrevibacter sp.]